MPASRNATGVRLAASAWRARSSRVTQSSDVESMAGAMAGYAQGASTPVASSVPAVHGNEAANRIP
jgi:hypothetical protein